MVTYAEQPTDIPARGWRQIARRAWSESKTDQVPLMAAGVAFFSFLSLFPALIAALLVYGLVRDPEEVAGQIANWTASMPADAASVVTTQLQELAASSDGSLGLGLVVALAVALWSAAGGMSNLITALNVAYDEEETRSFVRQKALALGLTLAAIVFAIGALSLVAVAPALLDGLVGSGPARWFAEGLRWTLLLVAMMGSLAVLYRIAPDREDPRICWVSVGAATVTVVWVIASVGFSLYVTYLGSYAQTYGALAGVVVLLLWLWMTFFLVLLGAELNAEAERQTLADTTADHGQG